jgi:hypothetical protein
MLVGWPQADKYKLVVGVWLQADKEADKELCFVQSMQTS